MLSPNETDVKQDHRRQPQIATNVDAVNYEDWMTLGLSLEQLLLTYSCLIVVG